MTISDRVSVSQVRQYISSGPPKLLPQSSALLSNPQFGWPSRMHVWPCSVKWNSVRTLMARDKTSSRRWSGRNGKEWSGAPLAGKRVPAAPFCSPSNDIARRGRQERRTCRVRVQPKTAGRTLPVNFEVGFSEGRGSGMAPSHCRCF